MARQHILFGDAAAYTLEYVLKQQKWHTARVFGVLDDLALGPLHSLEHRIEYVKKMLHGLYAPEADDVDCITDNLKRFWHKPFDRDLPVVVWHGANASEQLLLAFCCARIQQNRLYHLDLSAQARPYRAAGECAPDAFSAMLPAVEPIADALYQHRRALWQDISQSTNHLRIYREGAVVSVDDDYYDALILEICREKNGFVPLLRIVGEVLGRSEQLVGDTFITARVVYLIEAGKLIKSASSETELRSAHISLPR